MKHLTNLLFDGQKAILENKVRKTGGRKIAKNILGYITWTFGLVFLGTGISWIALAINGAVLGNPPEFGLGISALVFIGLAVLAFLGKLIVSSTEVHSERNNEKLEEDIAHLDKNKAIFEMIELAGKEDNKSEIAMAYAVAQMNNKRR